MPTAALSDEILLEGDGQVRALICLGANPMAAWPDQRKTQRALEKLELLVTLDVTMSLTSRLADYVVATRLQLETPGMTQRAEALKYYTPGIGFSPPYAQYSPRIVAPPPGSELIEEWEFFHGLARRLGHDLSMGVYFGFGAYSEAPPVQIQVRTSDQLSTEEIYERICATSRIPLEEVQRHPHGKIFDVHEVVRPKDPDCNGRLDVGNRYMMEELAAVSAFDFRKERENFEYPFRLIPRRSNHFINSSGLGLPRLNRGTRYNATFMHPQDLAELNLAPGDPITIRSAHDFIPGIVAADETLRRKVIAMHHCFGGLVDEDHKFVEQGSNVSRLVANDRQYDRITGIPRMSNIPVSVIPGWVDAEKTEQPGRSVSEA
jgi:anaerobic selenocysteine-containing dehydrogenase